MAESKMSVEGKHIHAYIHCTVCKVKKVDTVAMNMISHWPVVFASNRRGKESHIDHVVSIKLIKLQLMQLNQHVRGWGLSNSRTGAVNHLIALCPDVYDSLAVTPTSRLWPAPAMTTLRSKSVSPSSVSVVRPLRPWFSYTPQISDCI